MSPTASTSVDDQCLNIQMGREEITEPHDHAAAVPLHTGDHVLPEDAKNPRSRSKPLLRTFHATHPEDRTVE